jgi:hypothetical protein
MSLLLLIGVNCSVFVSWTRSLCFEVVFTTEKIVSIACQSTRWFSLAKHRGHITSRVTMTIRDPRVCPKNHTSFLKENVRSKQIRV